MNKPIHVLLGVLFLGLTILSAAEGPGIPNIAYNPARSGEILSIVNTGKAISGTAMHRGYLFVPLGADHGGGAGSGAFAFYDVSNPSAPVNIFDSRSHQSDYHNPGTLNHVGDWAELHHLPISGNLMAISEKRTNSAGFSIFDMAPLYDDDPQTRPRTISRYSYPGVTNPSNYDGYSFALGWQGQRYVYSPTGANGLFIVDTTNLLSPRLIAHRTRSQLGNLTLRQAIPIGNHLILTTVAIGGTFNAIIMDISNPANPVQIGSFNGPQGYQGFVYGSSFYGGSSPIQRHDFTHPASIVTTTLRKNPDFDRPEYGFGKDGYLFIGHYPGATKWKINGNTVDPAGQVLSGFVDDHAFLNPLGNLIALCTDHNNPKKLMIGIHGPEKDVAGPVPLYVSPAMNTSAAHPLSRVGISFSDFVDGTSLNGTTFTVRKTATTAAIPGSYSSMFGIVNFVPDAPLEPDTTYEVVLTAGGVKDQCGNGVATETLVTRFSTGNTVLNYSGRINPTTPTQIGSTANFDLDVITKGGPPLEYSWNFGDGTPSTPFSTSTSTSHTYSSVGNFPVTLNSRIVGRTTVTSVTAVQVIHHPLAPELPLNSTTIAVDPNQSLVWNVNADNNSVTAIHTSTFARVHEIPVGENPRTLAFGPSDTLWVVNRKSATLSVINRTTGSITATHSLPPGSDPHAILIRSGFAYVSLEAIGKVAKLNITTGTILDMAAVGPWPRSLALDPSRERLWVSRFISPNEMGVVTPIDLATFTVSAPTSIAIVTNPDSLSNGRGLPNYLGALAISPDLTQLYVPSKKDNILRGLTRDGLPLTFENTVRSMAANINLATGVENPERRLDFDNSDFANAVAYSPLGNLAYFTTSGSATIWAVDAYTASNEFTFNSGGLAPDGLAFNPDGSRLFIHNFMDRSVTIFDSSYSCGSICGATPMIATVATISTEALSPQVLRGKKHFYNTNDPRLAQEGYMSCASCHLDGGHDGRVWDLSNVGEGLRNTIDLTGKGAGNGPVHWTGNFDEIQDFEAQIRNLAGGTGLMADKDLYQWNRSDPLGASKSGISADLDALAAYVGSLQTSGRSPHRAADGSLTAVAAAGRVIFQQENCATCHGGESFADSISLQRHNVGTQSLSSGRRLGGPLDGFDTPSLRGLWKSAPYLHDGSAATLSEVLQQRDTSGQHGGLFHRSDTEIDQLVAYLSSIDDLEITAPSSTSSPSVVQPADQHSLESRSVSLALSATGTGPFTWQAIALPAGLTIDPTTGTITGAPSTTGDFTVRVAATDPSGRSGTATFNWTIPDDLHKKRFVKLVALSSLGGEPFASVAEFDLLDIAGVPLNRSGWRASASSEQPISEPASNAIDGSAWTIWHNEWMNGPDKPFPHELIIDLGQPRYFNSFRYLPRSLGGTNGRIANWRFHWSNDGINWGDPVAQGTFPHSAAAQVASPVPITGRITREHWNGITGILVEDLKNDPRYPNSPDGTSGPTSFQAPSDFGENFGSRMHGYLIPTVTGNYQFWIAGDEGSELWLGSDVQASSATLIASSPSWTNPLEWTKYPSQQSALIPLVSGKAYYISAIHKEGTGSDSLAVAWSGPGIARSVIPGRALAPIDSIVSNYPPVATGPQPVFNLFENSPIGTVIGTVTATDSNPTDTLTYQITSGNGAGLFTIDSITGILRCAGPIDYETAPTHRLQVLVTDNANPSAAVSIPVTISIGNIIETNSEVVKFSLAGRFPGHGNPALVGFSSDPDGDGIQNAIEILFGTDPASPDALAPVRFDRIEEDGRTYIAYEFDVAADVRPTLAFVCLGGTLDDSWRTLVNEPKLIRQSGGLRTYRVKDDFAIQDAQKRFMRIAVQPAAAARE